MRRYLQIKMIRLRLILFCVQCWVTYGFYKGRAEAAINAMDAQKYMAKWKAYEKLGDEAAVHLLETYEED